MADRIYLSYWLRGFTGNNMLRHFEILLGRFPFSKLSPPIVLRLRAIEESEPILFELGFEETPPPSEILAPAKEFLQPDCALEVEAKWDIWQFEHDWKVAPARLSLWCFGPDYANDGGESLRIDFGIDALFLPQPDSPVSFLPIQSNIRSLLHLVHELDRTLAAETRRLWTDSGENFAEKLQESLELPRIL